MNLFAKVKKMWIDLYPEGWWGDHIDVRFYVYHRLKKMRNKRVLDIACNAGILLTALNKTNDAYGIEIEHKKVLAARKITKARIKEGSMFKLPYQTNHFDVVVLANSLPGFDFRGTKNERKKTVKEARRVLKKNGVLILTTPNNAWYHAKKASKKDLEELLKGMDYTIRGWNPFPKWIPTRLLAKIPGMLGWLEKDMLSREATDQKYFYVEAVKK